MYYIFETPYNDFIIVKKEPHESLKYYPCDSPNFKISCSRYFSNLKDAKRVQRGLIEKDEAFLILINSSRDFNLIYTGENLEDLEIKIPECFI